MTASETVNKIIRLAIDYERHNVSMYELLSQTGYLQTWEQVTETAIRESLSRHPECVDAWFIYSENKRTDRGWYVKQASEERYLVGYVGAGTDFAPRTYSDKFEACADYVKRELDDMMKRAMRRMQEAGDATDS